MSMVYHIFFGKKSKIQIVVFVFMLLNCCDVLIAQYNTDEVSDRLEFKNELSSNHRLELSVLNSQLDTIRNNRAKAELYNRVAAIYFEASDYLRVSRYDSVLHYSNQAEILTDNDTGYKG